MTGDMMVSAGIIVCIGALNTQLRDILINSCINSSVDQSIKRQSLTKKPPVYHQVTNLDQLSITPIQGSEGIYKNKSS